jgi:methionyl-tRNA formyltransferase
MARVFLVTSHYMGVLYMRELMKAGENIVGVAAWPDSMGWYVPEEYDVRTHAFRSYLPLYEPAPEKLNSPEFLAVIRRLKPDFIVSGYYAKLFKRELLSIPKGGCVNIHPTGLPRFRGLSPYFTHMLHGDDRNWITMHWLDPGADTGDIIAKTSVEILPEDTGYTCGHRLTEAAAAMFAEYWPKVKDGTAPRVKQDESEASVFNFDWSMAEIDWSKPSREIWNLVRSVSVPLSGAWTWAGGRKMRVWKASPLPETDTRGAGTPNSGPASGPAVPGQLLALSGKGMQVQCGRGRLAVLEASFEDAPGTTPFEVLAPATGGRVPVVLG